jgi:hypothetical protein
MAYLRSERDARTQARACNLMGSGVQQSGGDGGGGGEGDRGILYCIYKSTILICNAETLCRLLRVLQTCKCQSRAKRGVNTGPEVRAKMKQSACTEEG